MSALSDSVAELRKNRKQWEAFETRSNCVVLAPPGSGKTKLLTTRMAFDLATEINRPQGAACITLTNAAADELRGRAEGLGVERRRNIFIGTVHAFALSRIIRPFARPAGLGEAVSLNIATAQQCSVALAEAIQAVFGRISRDAVKQVKNEVDVARKRLTSGIEWSMFQDGVADVALQYESSLKAQGLWDFESAIALAVHLVETIGEVRRVLTSTYPRLFVDEYQDLSPGLHRIVQSLCLDGDPRSTLFAVGDPDQAVFAFTGTRPELLFELCGHTSISSVDLDRNYRSGQDLIDLAGRMRQGRPSVLGTRKGGEFEVEKCVDGINHQIDRAVQFVKQGRDNGIPLHNLAVICPWNSHRDEVSAALQRAGLTASIRETEYRHSVSTTMIEQAAEWAVLGQERSGSRISSILSAWKVALGPAWSRSSEVELTSLLMKSQFLPGLSALDFFEGVLASSEQRLLNAQSGSEDGNELRRMRRSLREGRYSNLSLIDFAQSVKRTGRVEVTNMTLSKGLEFERVVVIGLDREMVPDYRSLRDPVKLAEDRRKFYVSITRARERLLLLYSGFVMPPWNEPKFTGPSDFLIEIGLT